jgi:hypothetical protein
MMPSVRDHRAANDAFAFGDPGTAVGDVFQSPLEAVLLNGASFCDRAVPALTSASGEGALGRRPVGSRRDLRLAAGPSAGGGPSTGGGTFDWRRDLRLAAGPSAHLPGR